ncbi:acyl-CoA dehydrogenase family protein [Corynebacterium vitaeruminis]|uniref:Acyl-CoA dehydrogenase n=1 Tax=Corynebacterium vitaeruminis DSM 20294 TaxID=1224164 RepID=W5XXE9_9CORY|nr:acyl-CoA dehydrogenase family protein [Corynebacterium vitaeruminis]AHI21637.1 acyl-CoA dehydrogenase [Corynebacterium vitaeruminis DSM 20294]
MSSTTASPSSLIEPTTDFYNVFDDVTGPDLEAWQRAASFADDCLPVINDAWEKAEYPMDLVKRLGELDLMTDGLDIEGHQHLSPLAAGLVNMEISRIDGSMSTVIAVQAGLAMRSIAYCGSEEQKKKWLGPMARCEVLGAFALTEPDHGSDSVALETTAHRDGDEWVINGAKRWIGNGACGDITIVWARTEDGEVSGFIVPQDTPGYNAETITGKVSLRAIHQALITFDNVRVPLDAQMPGAKTFRDTARVLTSTRTAVAWMALGHAIACYEAAREHALTRIQFGRPLAANQMIQQRLADMLGEITEISLLLRHITERDAQGTMRPEQAAMAKVRSTRAARRVAADARDMLGGSGILLENHVIRHMADIEACHTYEGTDTMQSLIIGKKITGVGAFR